ncbi:MAG: rhomboid family intramembrane serine protease [bacterium]|nr:rhomboid family intramembrane serine protease [Gammaproteobacteria bacterium]HIL96037.1 rhomboid family intramembrane serine protease [Pseudomonadales bacterium]
MQDVAENWISALKLILTLVILIWGIEIINNFLGHRLGAYGIYPRNVEALPGILLWPFLHGSIHHLIMNTTPLLVMGFFVALRGWWIFFKSVLLILVIGGLGVWLFGRPAYHIGASGLVFGFFGFLITLAIYERSIATFAIASFTVVYYGGMILGILPTDKFVSWEGHLFGLLAGMLSARLLAVKKTTF